MQECEGVPEPFIRAMGLFNPMVLELPEEAYQL